MNFSPQTPLHKAVRCCATLFVLALSACAPTPPPAWTGNAESEWRYISAPVAGRLTELQAQADAEPLARANSASAQAANTDKGRRQEELAATRAQLAQAHSHAGGC